VAAPDAAAAAAGGRDQQQRPPPLPDLRLGPALAPLDPPGGYAAADSLFLDDVRIALVGFGQGELLTALRAVREGGASRYPDLSHPGLTHIAVGADAGPAQLADARDYAARAGDGVRLVRPAWLARCLEARAALEPDAATSLPASATAMALAYAAPGGKLAAELAELAGGGNSRPDGLPGSQAPAALLAAAGVGQHSNPPWPAAGGGILSGLFFTLAAVRKSEVEKAAAQAIRCAGAACPARRRPLLRLG